MSDEIKPTAEGDCNDECPSFDGKRCRLTGFRERACEPAWNELRAEVASLTQRLAEAEGALHHSQDAIEAAVAGENAALARAEGAEKQLNLTRGAMEINKRAADRFESALAASRAEVERVRTALDEAAQSLMWIATPGHAVGARAIAEALDEVRAFARSRAGEARRALGLTYPEEASRG